MKRTDIDEPLPYVVTLWGLAIIAPDAPLPYEVVPQKTEEDED
jgi:hypothetical protein